MLAIIWALLCLLGLLFLLIRECTTQGLVEVSVRSGQVYGKTQPPIWRQAHVIQIQADVHRARSLAASAAG